MNQVNNAFSFPPRWNISSLGDILDFSNGINFSANQKGTKGVLTVDVLNMYGEQLNVLTENLYRVDKTVKKNKLLQNGDILFVRSSVKESGVGWASMFHSCNEPVTYCGFIIRGQPKQSNFEPRFLIYYLRQPQVRKRMIANSGKTAITNISQERLKPLVVPLPPLEEQKRIAAILDKADAIRRSRKQAIRLTEELLRSTFLDMFGDPVTNPKGWDKFELSKLGQVVTGNTPPRANPENYGDDIEWIKSDNITTPHHFLTLAAEGLSSQGKKIARIVPPNSILVACIAGSRSSIGRAALAEREVAFNQQINAIIPNPNVDPYFLYTQFFVAQHLVQAKSTDSMKGLVSKSKFSNIEFIRPPEQKQREFGKWFSKFHSWSSSLRDGEQYIANLFNSLLQKAFRGEL